MTPHTFKNHQDTCLQFLDEKLDVSYTFNLVDQDQNQTNFANVTAIKVNMADIVTKKHGSSKKLLVFDASVKLSFTAGSHEETVLETCGRLCSVKSCKCFEKVIWSSACYVDFYVRHLLFDLISDIFFKEYGLQVDSIDVEPKKGVFSIYFVAMVLILVLLIASFALYRVMINCNRKPVMTSVNI